MRVIGSGEHVIRSPSHLRSYRVLHAPAELVRNRHARSYWCLRLLRPDNLFQPSFQTSPDRYPEIFSFVREQVEDDPGVRLLSFGCSTGEEVFSLREYFPTAQIRGLDINPLNIAVCRRRRRRAGDRRVSFAVAGSVERERTASYDAIYCMAVLRHGDLTKSGALRCDHRLTFDAFERTVAGLARCVKHGGLLIIHYSNFRFCDSVVSPDFEPVLSLHDGYSDPRAPLFGRDNVRLNVPSYDDVVFRKVRAGGRPSRSDLAPTG